MNIEGVITGIKYEICLSEELDKFDINKVPTTCILALNNHSLAISRWVSPKRTRSYPYERVYKSLHISKKITVIPVVKDEGNGGDRDFLQWDTISLMSLLDVFVIFAYYNKAKVNSRNNLKVTSQEFDNSYVLDKINEISQYHSSALHWNLNELTTNFHSILEKVKSSYHSVENETGVKLHNPKGIDRFKNKIGKDVEYFMDFSRQKAEKAQAREFVTEQPKESLSTQSKAKITISNYLGGKYFFTVDEVEYTNKTLSLIEAKHSVSKKLPSKGDLKDALIKMILYSNLKDISVNNKSVKTHQSVIKLTSTKIDGTISSTSSERNKQSFFERNNLTTKQIELLKILFEEAKINSFTVLIEYAK